MNIKLWPLIRDCRTAGRLDTAGKFAGAALGLYSIALLVGTLWPFDLNFDPIFLKKKVAAVEWIPFTWRCPVCGFETRNKILNLTMFIPFGFLAGFLRSGRTMRERIVIPTALGFLFSMSIEIVQLFVPGRTTQASDLTLNTAGALLGAACYLLITGWTCRKEGTAPPAI